MQRLIEHSNSIPDGELFLEGDTRLIIVAGRFV
jgi:hypothetical protein